MSRVSNQIRVALHLAAQSLLSARVGTGVSVSLIAASVLFVVGADQSFRLLADVLARLVSSGPQYAATIDISRCARCRGILHEESLLQELVLASALTSVVVKRAGAQSIAPRRVAVRCVSPSSALPGIRWISSSARREWRDGHGEPVVLLGAALAPRKTLTTPLELLTEHGTWRVIGKIPERAALSADAADNNVMIVPWRAPFALLCARGRMLWQAVAGDSQVLAQRLSSIDELLRTGHQWRDRAPVNRFARENTAGHSRAGDAHKSPHRTPWRVHATDKFARMVNALVQRLSLWLLVVPATVSLLCGAGVFSVQALDGQARLHEFGIRRALGASRAALMWQLAAEAIMVGAAGLLAATALLALAGAVQLDAPSAIGRGLLLGAGIALPMSAVGVLSAGISAVRTASISALEGKGES